MTKFLPLLIAAIFLGRSDLKAQVKMIEIDTLTGLPNGRLPFDEPFVLKIPVSGKRAKTVSYIQIGRDGSIQTALDRGRKIEILPQKDVGEPKKIDKKYYLIANFKNPHLLAPGRQYSIFWSEDVSDKVLDFFDSYDDFRRTGTTTSDAKAAKLYEELRIEYKKRIGVEIGFVTGGYTSQIPTYYMDPALVFSGKYNSYLSSKASFATAASALNQYSTLYGDASLTALRNFIVVPPVVLDTSIRKRYLTEPRKLVDQLDKIININQGTYKNLLLGLIDINCNECAILDESKIEKRFTNLSTTFNAVSDLYALTRLFINAGGGGLVVAETQLKSFQDDLKNLKNNFEKTVLTERLAIKDAIYKLNLSEPRQLNADTFVPVFETRTKLSITPDFGVVTTRIGKDKANPYPFVPYFGFQINLRPINRDVSFWSYYHKPLHHLSIMAGWTAVKIDNGPNLSLGADSVQSFFGGTKGTLITGLGFRINNIIRLTAGGMWYFRYIQSQSNPLLFDDRKLKAWIFAGISLDLSIKDLLNGISEIFPLVPKRLPATAQAIAQN